MPQPVHTAVSMIPAVGSRVRLICDKIAVDCDVIDAKQAYGRVRLLVTPVAGHGSQWVEESRVTAIDGGSR